jgi:CelD/BcsL family acetyltransferase involved in cellulose biosynthesis
MAALKFLMSARKTIRKIVAKNCTPSMAQAVACAVGGSNWRAAELRKRQTFSVALKDLPPEYGSYIVSRGSSTRSKLKRSIRAYERRGPLSISAAESEQEKIAAWRTLSKFHDATWTTRHKRSAFRGCASRAFHEELILRPTHNIDLLTIKAGFEIVGVLYCFRTSRCAYYYQSGFNYDARDRHLLPGYVCHAFAIEHYRKMGLHTYQFMSGTGEYKLRLAECSAPLVSTEIGKGNGVNALSNACSAALNFFVRLVMKFL